MAYSSDSLDNILSHLSARVMNVIVDGCDARHLRFLMEFLAAWEKRPTCLAPIAYKWCSTISGVAGLEPRNDLLFQIQRRMMGHRNYSSAFSSTGPGLDLFRMGERSQPPTGFHPGLLLFRILQVGFRLVTPGRDQPALRLNHTPHHDLVFKRTLSSDDDEVIADGVCAWIADRDRMPAGSCVHHLATRVARDTPFSPRLRWMSMRLIERMWDNKLGVSELETVQLLNRLEVCMDDMDDKYKWIELLPDAICSQAGLKSLSIHYWHLLEQLLLTWSFPTTLLTRAVGLVGSLEEAEDREKLEIWMVLAWQFKGYRLGGTVNSEYLEHLKQATLKHLLRQPSALPRFEGLAESGKPPLDLCVALRRVCARARAEQSSLEPLLL